ncbi:MAG: murein biosynthesis integral membrane protein MurJ [Myxococcota bacterium]
MTAEAPGRRVNFVQAFLSSALATGLSRVFGVFREAAVTGFLGVGETSDAFNLAWTIPNVFRRFVADEGLTGAMIPALAKAEADGGVDELRRLGAAAFGALLLANVVLVAAGIAGAQWLVLAFAPAWSDEPDRLQLAVGMTRFMFPMVALFSAVSYFEGLLNYRGHFFVPKFGPALVSIGVIVGAVALGQWFDRPVYALVLGTIVGGVAEVALNVPAVWSYWGRLSVSLDFRSPRVRAIAREMSKVIAIGLFAQVNLLVLQQLATSLPAGSLTIYRNSTQLTDLAQGMIAVAIGSALLPNISASVSTQSWDQFRVELARALRLAAFLLVPAAVVLLCYGTPVTAMVFRVGKYRWEDVQLTASALKFLSPFVLGVAGINIVKKVYFALEQRGTLLVVGALGVGLTAALGWTLTPRFGLHGLVGALSLSIGLQLAAYFALLWWQLREKVGLGGLVLPLAKTVAASVPLGAVLLAAVPLGQWQDGPKNPLNWVVFAGGFGAAGGVYLLAALALRIDEVHAVLEKVRRRVRR